jgi:hypothetical protein
MMGNHTTQRNHYSSAGRRQAPVEAGTPYRTDVMRNNTNYDDLSKLVVIAFRTYSAIEGKIGPLSARNTGNDLFILTQDWLTEMIKNSYGMNCKTFEAMIESVERFYGVYRNAKRLPTPHIITHRGIQFSQEQFTITQVDVKEYLASSKNKDRTFNITSVHRVNVEGADPFFIENMKYGSYKHLIVRPKLGNAGTPTIDKWEVLLFERDVGYLIDHVDSNKNPRYNGSM